MNQKVTINKESFPAQEAPDAEKATMAYGLQVAKAIQSDWFRKDSGTSRFYNNRQEFHRLRLYARGEQSTQKYKDELAVDGDLSYLNLDWEPVPIIPKFVDIVVNGMQDRGFSIKAYSQDATATTERKRYFDTLKGEMENKQDLEALEQMTGVEMFENDKDKLPQSDEELMIHAELDYKQGIEIAEELAINQVLDSCQYPELVKRRIDRDLTVIGIGAGKHSFCPNEGIKLDYVDPADMVYSWSESPYFDDASYFGEVKRMNINEIKKMFPDMTEEELKKAKQIGSGHYDYQGLHYDDDQSATDPNLIEVLFFCWKTTENVIHKIKDNVNGGKKATRRDETFDPPKDGDGRYKYNKTQQVREVVYEGVSILGDSEKVLSWKKAKNMIRPKSTTYNVVMPYIVASPSYYKGRIESLVSRITKYADLIQIVHLKMQQVLQRMTPSGVYLDVDGLAEVDLGNGNNYNPREALNMYLQTGSVIGRSTTVDGEYNQGRVPIQELPGGSGQQIQTLSFAYEQYLNQIRNMTGLNEARDGTSPDERALVGVQKLAAANSNTATRHILDAGIYITTRMCEGISLRISDILEYSPLKDALVMQIGKYNTGVLDEIKELHIHDFGIFLELEPDAEEKAMLENNIQQALSRDQIYVEDAISVRSVKNVKLANQLLRVLRRKKEDRDMQLNQQNIQANADANAQSAQAKAQAEAEAAQIKAQSEIQVEQAKSQFKQQELLTEKEAELEILYYKHNLQMDIMGLQTQSNLVQGAQKIEGSKQVESAKARQKQDIQGTAPISINNKANTIDGQVQTGGLL